MKDALTKVWKAVQGPLVVLVFVAIIGVGGWSLGCARNDVRLTELASRYQREVTLLEGQLSEVRETVARTEDLLAESRADLITATRRVERSQELARDLEAELGTLSTGSGAIDELIGAIRRDVESIARELSGVPN